MEVQGSSSKLVRAIFVLLYRVDVVLVVCGTVEIPWKQLLCFLLTVVEQNCVFYPLRQNNS